MTKKDTLAALAERMYVFENMGVNELALQLKVNEKTIRNWRDELGWDKKREQFLSTKRCFHEELYNFARKLMATIEYDIDNNNKIDPARMFTFSKMLPLITKIKDYEDKREQDKNENDAKDKSLTPDFIKMINEEFLGIKSDEL